MLENKLSDEEIHAIVGEAVEMEIEFVTSALPCALIGMNADSMTEYVKYCADRLIVALGAPKLYNASQPFGWMEMISLQGKTFVACLLNTERSAALAACSRGLLAVRRNFFVCKQGLNKCSCSIAGVTVLDYRAPVLLGRSVASASIHAR